MSAFDALLVPEALRDAVSGEAWLSAMLDVERAIPAAAAQVGLVPAEDAVAVAELCRPGLFDWDELVARGRDGGSPVEPLVRELRERAGPAASAVHFGATTQDVLDTASVLVTRRVLGMVLGELDRVAASCATLADTHRSTPMVARTLLQQAVPTTFGLVAAGWLVMVLDVRQRLHELEAALVVQLGGAAGTLAAYGADGVRVVELVADELELAVPVVPWHTNRVRVAELGAALGTAAGACAKIGLDVVLLAQSEVAEVREASSGPSSTMPQKQNPVRAVLARAASRLARAHASVLEATLEQEHQRAAGAWHAEPEALNGALAFAGGAAWCVADSLSSLEIDTERMRANLEANGGTTLAERVSFALSETLGRARAIEVVTAAATGAVPFRDALLADPRAGLNVADVDELLDPEGYLGSAGAFVDRALAHYAEVRT